METRFATVCAGGRFLLLGMVHLAPLPGSPRHGSSMRAVVEAARGDARALRDGGLDGVVVENYGDLPFAPTALEPAALAGLAVATAAVAEELAGSGLLLGVNALRNDAAAALGVAVACGADLIRVNVHTGAAWTDQGLIQGQAHRTLRQRAALGVPVAVLADVLVKHAAPPHPQSAADAAREAVERGLADGLLVTGPVTGSGVDLERLRLAAAAVPGVPVLAGSGVAPEQLPALAAAGAAGALVGTWLKVDGRTEAPVDPARVAALVRARDRL